MKKSYIWPLTNRVSHILMILYFALVYILGDYKELLRYHVAFGYALGVLFLFRIAWGFIGPRYSKFSDFNFGLDELKSYLLSVFIKTKEYIGHNPASSWAIVAMMIVAFFTIVTGALAYGIEENHGIFSFLHSSYFKNMELFKKVHELFSNLFLMIVATHIAGSLIDKFIKKSDAIDSMISGYKKLKSSVEVKLNLLQKIFAIVWIASAVYVAVYLLISRESIFVANANKPIEYASLHKEFADECGSCHMIYPPYLLPKVSWVKMMSDLENHFGDDASLDAKTTASILSFLEKNSAENSTHQAALGVLKNFKDDNATIAITKTTFFKKMHKKLDKKIFDSKEVKSKANCVACHKGIDKGLLENDLISLPKGV